MNIDHTERACRKRRSLRYGVWATCSQELLGQYGLADTCGMPERKMAANGRRAARPSAAKRGSLPAADLPAIAASAY